MKFDRCALSGCLPKVVLLHQFLCGSCKRTTSELTLFTVPDCLHGMGSIATSWGCDLPY
jgi:hypothetical protein